MLGAQQGRRRAAGRAGCARSAQAGVRAGAAGSRTRGALRRRASRRAAGARGSRGWLRAVHSAYFRSDLTWFFSLVTK